MTGATLEATSGVLIQGASIALDGTLTPQPAWTLPVSGSTIGCYMDPLSAALITTG